MKFVIGFVPAMGGWFLVNGFDFLFLNLFLEHF